MLCQIKPMRRALAYLSCFVILAAQGFSGVSDAFAQAPPGTLDFDPTNPPTQTLVMRGETLFNIAERTRAPIEGLIRVNALVPPFAIQPGQVLRLPPLKVHVVQSGETFAAIAARYNVDARSLAVFNRLTRPVIVKKDQRIVLPPMVVDRLTGLEPQDLVDLLANEINAGRTVTGSIPGQIVTNTEAVSPQLSPPPPAMPPQLAPRQQAVLGPSSDGSGETGVRPAPARSTSTIGPFEDGDGVAVQPRGPTRPPAALPSATQLASLPPPPPVPPRPPQPSPSLPLPNVTDLQVPSLTGIFAWPVIGAIIETFGTKRDLRVLDGIEIEAPAGTPFKSAAAGTVVYVGNQLPGYGWLVLIRHADGLMSAYAYAQSVSVRENQSVTKGQVIGLVGVTGRATTPRLHFQIRYNTRPIDPLPRLPRVRGAA
jgi:murein DD-endopeptidase MepM/ murein hydrolase activator NlpD